MELGTFGTVALAASNIAFSMNSLIFIPALGVNMAVSSLVGQAMGRRQPLEAERVAWHSLHIVAAYMLPVSVLIAIFAPQLMDIFRPGDMSPEEFVQVRELGVILLYFIVIYSFIDSGNIVYFGALKGAGDTMGVLMLMGGALVLLLIIPIGLMKYFGVAGVYTMWMAFTVYVILLAVGAMVRFYRRGWHSIRVVETPPE
jgi:MATE family multidrug resistance protein